MDGIFRDRLRDYSQAAPNEVWGNIEKSLNARQKTKRLLVYKIAASVAAIAILGISYLYFTNQEVPVNQKVAIVEKQKASVAGDLDEKKPANAQAVIKEQNNHKKSVPAASESRNKSANKNYIAEELETPDQLSGNVSAIADEKKINSTLQKLAQKKISVLTAHTQGNIVDARKQKIKSVLNSLPDIYSHSFAANDWKEPELNKNIKWIIGGDFTPLYSYRNITSTQGEYNSDYYNSVERPVMSYTGGLNLQYKAVDRLTIQAGVYYTTMGQSFDYMSVYANSAYKMVDEQYKDRFINVYSIENSTGDVSFNSQYVIVDNKSTRVENLSNNKAVADVSDPIYDKLGAEIQQNFQYVEVPFLMRYKLVDKEVDINILGGFGANFLVGNDVFFKYAGNKEVIGKTEGVNTVNYNSTFGFGIEYPIVKRINIRIEPSIKYYLNEINSNSSVESHPYSVGIYTGINYSF